MSVFRPPLESYWAILSHIHQQWSPVLGILQVNEGVDKGVDPTLAGAKVSGVDEVIMPKSLLELFGHLVKICEVISNL